MISKNTLFLTADRESVVNEGDPKAQFLLVRAGQELPDALAEKYGVTSDFRLPTSDLRPADASAKIDKRHTRIVKGESHR